MIRRLLFAICLLIGGSATAMAAMPIPAIRFVGARPCPESGVAWICYELEVVNRRDYADALFQRAANLPVCGPDPDPLRIRVGVYDLGNPGAVIQLLCPQKRSDLGSLKFAIRKGHYQTGYVMIRIIDALTNESRTSNILKIYEPPRRPTGVRRGLAPPVSPN